MVLFQNDQRSIKVKQPCSFVSPWKYSWHCTMHILKEKGQQKNVWSPKTTKTKLDKWHCNTWTTVLVYLSFTTYNANKVRLPTYCVLCKIVPIHISKWTSRVVHSISISLACRSIVEGMRGNACWPMPLCCSKLTFNLDVWAKHCRLITVCP